MLSIITPVYNGGKFIEGCIENVIEQECPDVEHIIVDGGSTDNTAEVLKCLASKYDHIRWVSEKDKGQSDAMNKGIAMAKGDIVSFLNVDDFYEPGVFNRILKIFEALPEPTFLTGNCNILDEINKEKHISKPKKMELKDLLLGFGVNPHPVNPTSYFYHKSLHQEVGLYDAEVQIAMDQEFIFRLAQNKIHIKYIDEVWGNFRVIEGTKTANDKATGEIIKRDKEILEDYRRHLPWHQRYIVIIQYIFFNRVLAFCRTIKHCLKDPSRVAIALRRQLKGK